MKIRLALFWEMFKISLFVVGGGFAILAVADDRFSRKLKWTKEGEIVSHLPVFQMVPGIIAGSTAIYVGRKIAGVSGAACALMGAIIPSIAVFSAVSAGYSAIPVSNQWMVAVFTGLRAALTGVIAAMVVKTWRKCLSGPASYAVLAVSLSAIGPGGANPAVVVAAAAVAGVALECARRRDPGKGASFASSIWAFPLVFVKYGSIAFGGGYVLVPAYVRQDYWWKPGCWAESLLNVTLPYLAAAVMPPVLRSAPGIPVYHDQRVMLTMRQSIRHLTDGHNLIIFPEQPSGYKSHHTWINTGFLHVAPLYHKATGKALRFYPVHIDHRNHTFTIAKPVVYDPERTLEEQTEDIVNVLAPGLRGEAPE